MRRCCGEPDTPSCPVRSRCSTGRERGWGLAARSALAQPDGGVVEEAAFVERVAFADRARDEQLADRQGALDEILDFRELVDRERADTVVSRPRAGSEDLANLVEREADALADVDDREAAHVSGL